MTELIVRLVVEASPGLASLLERLCAGGQRESVPLPQPTPGVVRNKAVEAIEVKKPSALLGKMTPERKQLIANMRAGGCGWGEIFTAVNELPGGKFSTPNTLSGWALKLIKTGAIPTPNENVVVPRAASPEAMAPVVRALQKGVVDDEHTVKMSPRDILTWARNNRLDVTTGTEDEILQRINRTRKNMQLPPFAVDPWLRSEL